MGSGLWPHQTIGGQVGADLSRESVGAAWNTRALGRPESVTGVCVRIQATFGHIAIAAPAAVRARRTLRCAFEAGGVAVCAGRTLCKD